MQKGLAVFMVVLVMGSSEMAAAAQPRSPHDRAVPAAVVQGVAPAERESSPVPLSTYARIPIFPAGILQSEFSAEQTPFFHDMHLAVAEFWEGRVELGCFHRSRPRNLFAVPSPAKVFLAPPRESSYGIRLSIHFGREPEPDDQINGRRCEEWVIGSGRGCGPWRR